VTVQRQILTHTTHHVINHAPFIGAPFAAGLPLVVAPAAAPAAEPAAAAAEPAAETPAVEQA
jgi:hypothetical protein